MASASASRSTAWPTWPTGGVTWPRTRALYERAMAVNREFGYRVDVVMHNLGALAEEEGDLEGARRLFEESVAVKRTLGDSLGLALSLAKLGEVIGTQGDMRLAHQLLGESVSIQRELGDVHSVAFGLERFAIVAAAHGRAQRACSWPVPRPRYARRSALHWQPPHRRPSTPASPRRGQSACAAGGSRLGARASHEHGCSHRLRAERGRRGGSETSSVANALAMDHPALTPREREVAVRIARGLTNRQMAVELALAERTVDVHVSNILSKLDMSSRAQVAAWVVENGWLGQPERGGEAARLYAYVVSQTYALSLMPAEQVDRRLPASTCREQSE